MSKKQQDNKTAELPAEDNLPSVQQSVDVEPVKKESEKETAKKSEKKEVKLPKTARFLVNTGVSLPMEDGTHFYMAFTKRELIEDTALVEKLFALNLSTSVVIFE